MDAAQPYHAQISASQEPSRQLLSAGTPPVQREYDHKRTHSTYIIICNLLVRSETRSSAKA
jgi:hypothetical protein